MLLNEFLKSIGPSQNSRAHNRRTHDDGPRRSRRASKRLPAHQQEQIEALTAGLQKVSARLELNKLAPQRVADISNRRCLLTDN